MPGGIDALARRIRRTRPKRLKGIKTKLRMYFDWNHLIYGPLPHGEPDPPSEAPRADIMAAEVLRKINAKLVENSEWHRAYDVEQHELCPNLRMRSIPDISEIEIQKRDSAMRTERVVRKLYRGLQKINVCPKVVRVTGFRLPHFGLVADKLREKCTCQLVKEVEELKEKKRKRKMFEPFRRVCSFLSQDGQGPKRKRKQEPCAAGEAKNEPQEVRVPTRIKQEPCVQVGNTDNEPWPIRMAPLSTARWWRVCNSSGKWHNKRDKLGRWLPTLRENPGKVAQKPARRQEVRFVDHMLTRADHKQCETRRCEKCEEFEDYGRCADCEEFDDHENQIVPCQHIIRKAKPDFVMEEEGPYHYLRRFPFLEDFEHKPFDEQVILNENASCRQRAEALEFMQPAKRNKWLLATAKISPKDAKQTLAILDMRARKRKAPKAPKGEYLFDWGSGQSKGACHVCEDPSSTLRIMKCPNGRRSHSICEMCLRDKAGVSGRWSDAGRVYDDLKVKTAQMVDVSPGVVNLRGTESWCCVVQLPPTRFFPNPSTLMFCSMLGVPWKVPLSEM